MNLGQGNPDLPTPPHIVSALKESAGVLPFQQYAPFRGFDFSNKPLQIFIDRNSVLRLIRRRKLLFSLAEKRDCMS